MEIKLQYTEKCGKRSARGDIRKIKNGEGGVVVERRNTGGAEG